MHAQIDYAAALDAVRHRLAWGGPTGVVAFLAETFPHYSWVGTYWVQGRDLLLGPWKGPRATEHTRISIGTGVCGAAAASGRTKVVDDVSADPRYLACFPSTRSSYLAGARSLAPVCRPPTCGRHRQRLWRT